MKSKAPLLLMEQMVMLLVFALAAARCLQAFVKSDSLSDRSERRDRAITAAQTAAETVRHCRGHMPEAAKLLGTDHYTDTSVLVVYDKDWNLAENTMRYHLGVTLQDSGIDGLGMAQVWVRDEAVEESEAELLRFDVMWQEPLLVEVDDGTAE